MDALRIGGAPQLAQGRARALLPRKSPAYDAEGCSAWAAGTCAIPVDVRDVIGRVADGSGRGVQARTAPPSCAAGPYHGLPGRRARHNG